MKITRVEAIPFGVPIHSYTDAYGGFTEVHNVLVRITTDTGVIGYGEACAWEPEFYGETPASVVAAIHSCAAPALIGEDPLHIHRLMAAVDARLARSSCAKQGIDLALHDLVGKVLGVPVHVLLGGSFRTTVPVAAEIGIDTPEAMARNARAVVNGGIRVIKLKGSRDVDRDVERVHAVREAVGYAVGLRLDPNAAWTVTSAIHVARRVESCRLEYLEQPIPGFDLKGMAHIRQSIGIPLMADEGIWSPEDVVKIAEYRAADIINVKLAKAGGLARAKQIEAIAAAEGIVCVSGSEIEPGFSLVAKLHLIASLRAHPYAGEFTELTLLKASILKERIEIVEGHVAVPQGPGLGVELDEAALTAHRRSA